jgi:hypothetical protein
MKPEHFESLVWESIDGGLSAAERADLEDHIEGHPEARALQKEIEKLAEQLDGLGRAAPPESLRPRITAALQDVPTPTRTTHTSSTSVVPLASRRRSVAWLPLAASLLVGVAVGYLLQPGTGGSVDRSSVVGSMTATSADTASREMEITLGERAGTLAVGRNDGDTSIRIDLATTTDLEIVLEVADGFLLPTGIDTTASAGFEVEAEGSRTVIRTRGPAVHELVITATAAVSPVHLIVRSGGAVVADDWLAGDENGNRG